MARKGRNDYRTSNSQSKDNRKSSVKKSSVKLAPTLKMKRRLNRVVAAVLAIFTIYIVYNLVGISIVDSGFYRDIANNQQLNSMPIPANRGSIIDANGKVLAQSATVWTVFISPTDIRKNEDSKRELIADGLSEILDVKKDTVLKKIEKNNQYEEIKREVPKDKADEVMQFAVDNKIRSIYRTEGTKRYYPNESLAANVIGFTNYDNDGVYGLEAYYDDYLKGVPGRSVSARDASGNEVPYRYEKVYDAKRGNDVILTIDSVLQHFLEKNLANTVELHKVRDRASGIIMDVNTGAILAMATSPSFDPNNPGTIYDPDKQAYIKKLQEDESVDEDMISKETAILREAQWKNKAITELYYPGSVFKVVTVSSALEESKVSLSDSFSCSGSINIAGTRFGCWRPQGHGSVSLTEAVVVSCNPAHIEIGQRLGAAVFSKYFRSYGFTDKTGIDLPGEAGSLTVPESKMGPVELASCSFGQSNKITPIQMITAFAAVVNGGNLVTPYVVDKVIDSEGRVMMESQPKIKRQVISKETSLAMRGILEEVVSTNQGNNAYIKGYNIGGKSGTSQKQDEDIITNENNYVSSFCGFAPDDDPQIIMLVMVDTPKGGQYYGGAVASPVVSAVFKEALPYLGMYPQYTQEELAELEVAIPYIVGEDRMNAEAKLASSGINTILIGDGDEVIRQFPSSGTLIPRDGSVIIYTDEDSDDAMTKVPDVTGMSLLEANTAITNAGLNIRLSGGAVQNDKARAVSQTIESGEEVPKGTIIEVTFVIDDETG